MDRIECIKTFARVVEAGSFSAVAMELDTTQPTISKQIAALEEHLGVQLLIRSTRSLKLTDEGARFFEQCDRLIKAVEAAEASVGHKQKPSGILRISCPVSLSQHQVVPRLKAFLNRYPDIKIDLKISDGFVSLVEEGIDVAIRIGSVSDASLISKRIGMTRRVTIGAASYFEGAGIPKTPQELSQHNCIIYSRLSTKNEWHFQKKECVINAKRNVEGISVIVRGNFETDNSTAIRVAVLSGLGIAVAPVWLFGDDLHQSSLVAVLQDYEPTALPIHAVYRRGRFVPARVRYFINFLADEFKLDPWVTDYGQAL